MTTLDEEMTKEDIISLAHLIGHSDSRLITGETSIVERLS
jgi:hypothetical protein